MTNSMIILIASLLFVSCSSGKLIKSVPMEHSLETEINERGKNNYAKIRLFDEQVVFAKDLFIKADSINYCNLEDSSVSVISLGLVKEVRFVYHLEGAMFGMITGGLFLKLIGHLKDNSITDASTNYNQIFMIGGVILGAVIGGTTGIHRYYEFVTDKEISKENK